jgi:hypothetical protein
MLGLDLEARQKTLPLLKDLASDAAACAIESNEYARAVEFLEAGRSVFWSQALQLRTPFDRLNTAHPDVGRRMEKIMRELETASHRDLSEARMLPAYSENHISVEAETNRYRRLNKEWLHALEEVRTLEGFEDFLLPKSILTLQQAATHGPIVILNSSSNGCAALIVTHSADVRCVPLPDMTHQRVAFLSRSLSRSELDIAEYLVQYPDSSISQNLKRSVNPRFTMSLEVLDSGLPRNHNEVLGFVLGILWESVAKPVLDAMDLKVTS